MIGNYKGGSLSAVQANVKAALKNKLAGERVPTGHSSNLNFTPRKELSGN
jgi:hypothetical protein